MKNHLDFVAPDILVETDTSGIIWLTQNGEHYCFPTMEFSREIVDLKEEGYLQGYTYGENPLTLIRAAVAH